MSIIKKLPILLLLLSTLAFAGELEELQCKKESVEKDLIILQLQSQILQLQYNLKQSEKQAIEEKLNILLQEKQIKDATKPEK